VTRMYIVCIHSNPGDGASIIAAFDGGSSSVLLVLEDLFFVVEGAARLIRGWRLSGGLGRIKTCVDFLQRYISESGN